jgi:cytidylate kinase
MTSRIISVSRSLGAGGEEVGRTVAKELGFRYADEEIIVEAAQKAGVSPETVAQAEHTPGLITRILESMARFPIDPESWSARAMLPPASPGYETLIVRVVQETAKEGDVVIVAHGASIPLAGTGGLLRVLVTGSPAARAERLGREAGMGEAQARKAVDESDRQRRGYLRRFYDLRQELPTHYDLVLNTDILTPPLAARLVVIAAKE